MVQTKFTSTFGMAVLIVAMAVLLAACGDDDPVSPEPDPDPEDLTQVELETRGEAEQIVGVWTPEDGWTDEDGNPIDQLQGPMEDGADLAPLRAGGPNASLTVRVFDEDGNDIEIETADRPDIETLFAGATSERTCESAFGEVGAEFNVVNGEEKIAWPPTEHPDGFGDAQFAFGKDGSYPAIFHCDHIHFYPEEAGTFEVEIMTADEQVVTDPIEVEIEESEEVGEARIETRGEQELTIGVWTPEDGWTDDEGNPIDQLDPIEADLGESRPLIADGQENASLTVRFFDMDGDEYDINTEERQDIVTDEPGADEERVCTDFSSRFGIEGGTDVISWPSTEHPDGFGEHHFAQWGAADDTWIANFHCDHIHFYPEQDGEFDVEFALYDEGAERNVAYTDPITVQVDPDDAE